MAEEYYTITYQSDYGAAPGTAVVLAGEYGYYYLTADDLPELEEEGFNFLGWYNAPEGGTRYEAYNGAMLLPWCMIEDSVTMYARWEEVPPVVRVQERRMWGSSAVVVHRETGAADVVLEDGTTLAAAIANGVLGGGGGSGGGSGGGYIPLDAPFATTASGSVTEGDDSGMAMETSGDARITLDGAAGVQLYSRLQRRMLANGTAIGSTTTSEALLAIGGKFTFGLRDTEGTSMELDSAGLALSQYSQTLRVRGLPNLAGLRISGLAAPAADTDAATKAYADAREAAAKAYADTLFNSITNGNEVGY